MNTYQYSASATSQRGLGLLELLVVSAATTAVVINRGPFTLLAVLALLLLPLTKDIRKIRPFKFLGIWLLVSGALAVVISAVHFQVALPTLFSLTYSASIYFVAMFVAVISGGSQKKLCQLALAISIGLCAGYFVQPFGVVQGEPLKSGLGHALLLAAFSLIGLYKIGRIQTFAITLVLAGVFVSQDARNFAAVSALTGAVVLASKFIVGQKKFRPGLSALVLAATVGAAGLVIVGAYGSLAESGALGLVAEQKYQRQAGVEGGILVGGRPELALSITAIESHPIVGRGGNPVATTEERIVALDLLDKAGNPLSNWEIRRIVSGGINSHSVLFSSWVILGVVGPAIWVTLLALIWLGAIYAMRFSLPTSCLLVFGSLQMSWDVLFSPWNVRFESFWGLLAAASCYSIVYAKRLLAEDRGIATLGETNAAER